MRQGSAFRDALYQGRLYPMQRLRPVMWGHARDGAVRPASTKIDTLVTGAPYLFSQSTDANRPTRGFARMAPTAEFVRASTLRLSNASAFSALSSCTLCVLAQADTVSGTDVALALVDASNNIHAELRYQRVSTTVTLRAEAAGSSNQITISEGLQHLSVVTHNATTDTSVWRVNGSQQATWVNPLSVNGVNGYMGARNTINALNGKVWEALIFDRVLNTRELWILEGLVAWLSNASSLLAGNHPFRYRPPMLGD